MIELRCLITTHFSDYSFPAVFAARVKRLHQQRELFRPEPAEEVISRLTHP
jgi:hypothetical protein